MDASDTGVTSDPCILPSILPSLGKTKKKAGMKAGMHTSDTGVASDPPIHLGFGRIKETNKECSAPLQSLNHPKSSAFTLSMIGKADGLTDDGKRLSFPVDRRRRGSSSRCKNINDWTEEELRDLLHPKTTMTDEEFAACHREANLKYAKVALEAFNKANGVDFELVDPGCSRFFHAVVPGHDANWYHINFKARPKSSSSGDHPVQLFFAELKLVYYGEVVNVCMPLDPAEATNDRCLCWRGCMTCEFCGTHILHPSVGSLEAGYHLVAALVEHIRALRQESGGP